MDFFSLDARNYLIAVHDMKNKWTFSFGSLYTGKITMLCSISFFSNHNCYVDSWQKKKNCNNLSHKMFFSCLLHSITHMWPELFIGMGLLGNEYFHESIFPPLLVLRIYVSSCKIIKNTFVQRFPLNNPLATGSIGLLQHN